MSDFQKNIINKFKSEPKFYGTMYGQDIVHIGGINGRYSELDRVIEISKSKLELTKNNDGFIFIWGMPGPDYNIYWFKDYGITWAFELKDFKNKERKFCFKDEEIKIKDII